ncbi:YdeI/OmpD-associated family protein [Chitinophagaceae bacterium LB-8]|uniref:YdeI/OmpD-associated family protein n=1 Tax=Paraflavisolibacter caeni TaxID=2982496 RepID=A0A9X2XY50_9BACT|nr:YdeI/OmpD-associated family protein [Paraflavisolibacter caeni]MCU7550727.1 YdeI/OmpD-associated family protein [Paraflavisolibacter caeni]
MAAPKKDAKEQVTNYIETLPTWSQNICNRLRDIILSANPSIVEDWKWGPNYNSNGMICGYGAGQKHVKFTFFNGSAMSDGKNLFNHCVDNEFSRSIKYTDESQIDELALAEYIKESIAVNQKGFKREVKDKTVDVPSELLEALLENEKAKAFFDALSYGYKKEFVELVTTAKQEKTRNERIAKVVSYCAEGKKLNDKYKTKTV